MIRITPEQFRDAFSQCVAHHAVDIATLWDRYKDYTTFVRGTVLPSIAAKLALQAHCSDYYTLDAVFYEVNDDKHFDPATKYAKYIAVAIEHENDARSTYTEMNKLQLFNSPLKVLITYNSGKDNDKQLRTLMAEYATIVNEADVFGDFSELRRTLLIVGEKPDEVPRWRFFTYQEGKFEEID